MKKRRDGIKDEREEIGVVVGGLALAYESGLQVFLPFSLGEPLDSIKDGRKQVSVVIRCFPLGGGDEPLEAQSRIQMAQTQLTQQSRRLTIVLKEE